MDEKDIQEFSLEDILKEFGDSDSGVEEDVSMETLFEETPVEEPQEEAPAQQEAPSRVTDETIRLDTISFTHGQVRNAQPIEDEEEEVEAAAPQEPEEAFSADWEPEYEQPIAEYIPPQPIIFHPRSRLRELKKKLIAGPEKQYYALSEKGLGKLQASIFFSVLVVLISAVATAMYAFGMVQQDRMRLMVFGQFLAMLVSALLGSYQLIEGVTDLCRGRFSLNTLLVFTLVICCVDGVLCLQQLRVPCCAAFSLEMTMSLWSAYQRRNTQLGQLDTMRKATRLDSLTAAQDYYNGQTGFLRGEGQVEDFMDTYEAPARTEKLLSIYAFGALIASVCIGVVAAILHGISVGIQVTSVTLLAAMPATMFITQSRPMAILERRLHSLGTVLCGWQGIEGLCKKAVFPLSHDDLFPVGSVKMNGVKFYGDREPDEIISYATALIAANDGSMVPLFNQLLDSRNGVHYQAENFRIYENGGIGGEVCGEPVLVGSLPFLRDMGVDVPQGIRVGQAVCVAIDGELCGLFAIAYEKVKASSAGLVTLCAYRGLNPVLTTSDFMLTGSFLQSKFGIHPRKIHMPEHETRAKLRGKELESDAQALALTTQEGLAPLAYAVTGARSVWTTSITGMIIHMIGGIIGVAMMLVLAILGAQHLLTPGNLFLYELIWMIPGLMITEWTRSV